MSIYKYAMGGETEGPIEEKVEKMKSDILSALKGGASDKEITMMIQDSGLQDKYEFNWDNVEMKVEAYPIESAPKAAAAGAARGASAGLMELLKKARGAAESDRFGEPDMPGQRSDNFDQGGKTYAGQYFSPVVTDADFRDYVLYVPDYEGNVLEMTDMDFKRLEDAGAQRIYLPTDARGLTADKRIPLIKSGGRELLADDDFQIVEIGGKSVLMPVDRPAPAPYDAEEKQMSRQTMGERTQGASKVENLLEKLSDVKRNAMGGKSYEFK